MDCVCLYVKIGGRFCSKNTHSAHVKIFFGQGRGQFISTLCSASSTDYICTPCSQYCFPGSFVAGRCTGTGRGDTTCSLCKSTCKAGQKGMVPARPGEYVSGQCTGMTYGDVQACIPCKTCPAGQWPSGVCDGLSSTDTIVCTPCATMDSCPNGTHYYLDGNCEVEEVKCKLCDPPCDPSLYVETVPCALGKNRVCAPKTMCIEAQCPAGFWESAPCTNPVGPKVCSACTRCKAGEYVEQACTARQDTKCTPCRSSCADQAGSKNGMTGSCYSMDTADSVQCVYSPTPLGQPCGADEWLVGTLNATAQECNMGGGLDTGTPSNLLHPFRSDFSVDGSRVAFLGSSGSGGTRQAVVRVMETGTGKLLSYVFPRAAYYNRIDAYGSQKDASSAYPIAALLAWSAKDVMLSYDGKAVYIFLSDTLDFIGKCTLGREGTELQASDCGVLSPAALSYSMLGNSNQVVHKGCVRMMPSRKLACLYDAKDTMSFLMALDEDVVNATKTVLESSVTVSGLQRPKSGVAWNAANRTLYYIADVNAGQEYAVRYFTVSASYSAGTGGWLYRAVGSASPDYHALVWNGNYLVAANRSALVSFAGGVRSEVDTGENSIKDLAVRGNAGQLLVLVHRMAMWTMHTHCAPCPANSYSPAGSTTAGIGASCKCRDDFFGTVARYCTTFFIFLENLI